MPTTILFILVLLLVVVIHEAGHFFAAKQMGMRVSEFAFGFKPKLFGWTKGETTYSINAIPLGGYVSIDGENGDEVTADPRLFTNKSKAAQAWVLFAGPMMNIVLAIVLLSLSYMIGYGDGKTNSLVVLSVNPNSPAFNAGIKEGDKISAISNTENPDVLGFKTGINEGNGNAVDIKVERSKETQTFSVTPTKDGEDYKIGVSLGELKSQKLGFFTAIGQGFKDAMTMTRDTVVGFGKIIASIFVDNGTKGSLTGPIGIAKEVGTASGFGFAYLLSFIALISVNLGVLNMFPFPALDGGRLLFLLIEKIKGSRIKPSTGNVINTIGFGLLIVLMVFVTVKDVIKLF